MPCYYWIEDEARGGEPVDGYVVDLGVGQKGLRATLPHFSAYGFAAPPPPEDLPADMPDPDDPADPDGPEDNPEKDKNICPLGSEINLMSGVLCQTIGTKALPSLGGLQTQITAKYNSGSVNHTTVVSTNLGLQTNSAVPDEIFWYIGIGRSFNTGGYYDVYFEWDGKNNEGYPYPPGVNMGALNVTFKYGDPLCSGCWKNTFESDKEWPMIVVRDDLSPFGIGWFSPHDILLVDHGDWVTVVLSEGRQLHFEKLLEGGYNSPPGEFTTLESNPDGTWTGTYHDGSTYTFNEDGRLTRIQENRYGNFQSLLYESNGQAVPEGRWGLRTRIRRVTDTSGNTFDYAYNPAGWLASITDSAGRVYSYEHDAQGHLTASIDPLGQREEFSYDAQGFMTSHTDKRGYTTSYVLDEQGRVVTRTWPTGTDLQVIYAEKQVDLTLDNGSPIVTTLNENYSPVARFNGVYTTVTTYNDELQPQSGTNVPQTTLYNANGQVIEVIIATTLQLERNAPFNRVSRATSSDGGDMSYAYDAQGNRTGMSDALGQSYQMTYNALGQVQTISDPLGNTTSLVYDGRGLVMQITTPTGEVQQMGHDPAGNLTSLVDALNNVTTMTFDDLNRLIEISDALGGLITMTYDAGDNLATISDQTGRTIDYSYDSINRLTGTTYADGGGESFTYDASGNLTGMTDARGQAINWSFDAAQRATQKMVQDGPTVDYSYDDYDQPTQVYDGAPLTDIYYLPDTLGKPLRQVQAASGMPLDVSIDYAYSGGAIDYAGADAPDPLPDPQADDEIPLVAAHGESPEAAPEFESPAEENPGEQVGPPLNLQDELEPESPDEPNEINTLTCDVTLSGNITSDQTLDPNDGVVHCFSNLTIEAGATITVPAGVQFAAESGDLFVAGALVLDGEPEELRHPDLAPRWTGDQFGPPVCRQCAGRRAHRVPARRVPLCG